MTASRLPQSRRLRPPGIGYSAITAHRLKIAAVAATAAVNCSIRSERQKQLRLKIAAVAATAAARPITISCVGTLPASRLPQSRRLRHKAATLFLAPSNIPPQDCRSRGDCGWSAPCHFRRSSGPPHDCRSRGDCGGASSELSATQTLTASRLPQSRRLRLDAECSTRFGENPPQDCRSRGDCGSPEARFESGCNGRLKIAAVAATAAGMKVFDVSQPSTPPQDCRSRGDCGFA